MGVTIARRHPLGRLDPGGLIRSVRTQAGLSQTALAEAIGTKQPVISRWERGDDAPRLDTLVRILRACGWEADLLVRHHDDVDRAQIREHLAMTPEQRLAHVEGMHRFAQLARRAARTPTRG